MRAMDKINPLNPYALALIDLAAHQGAYGANPRPHPTAPQIQAGNYAKGKFNLHGLEISIENPKDSYREGVDPGGKAWRQRLAAHYGYFRGTRGADGDPVDVFVGPFPASDRAYIVNQHVGGQFDEHKCLIGFHDEDEARSAYLHSYAPGWPGLESMVPASIDQLKFWLKNGDMKRPLAPEHLPYEAPPMLTRTYWTDSAEPIGTNWTQLLYAMAQPQEGELGMLLYDPVTMDDIRADADGRLAFDAMVTPYAKLDSKMAVLRNIMDRSGNGLKVTAVQISEPFKQRGVANVAAVFELTDGQTVSIFFHNPDVTPAKMAPTDEVISWKWLLNKKDITIVVAPERGTDLNVREVARRVMKLAEKNSVAFAKANTNRAEKMARIEGKKETVARLEGELSDWQHKIEIAKIEAEDAAARAAEEAAKAATAEPPPWIGASQEDEDRWFGTKIRLIAKDRKRAARGLMQEGEATLYTVRNGGNLLEVRWPDQDFQFRANMKDTYDVEVLELVDNKAAETKPEPSPTPTISTTAPYIPVASLIEHYKASGLSAQGAWDQYVKDTIMSKLIRAEEIDAKDLVRIYNGIQYPVKSDKYPGGTVAPQKPAPEPTPNPYESPESGLAERTVNLDPADPMRGGYKFAQITQEAADLLALSVGRAGPYRAAEAIDRYLSGQGFAVAWSASTAVLDDASSAQAALFALDGPRSILGEITYQGEKVGSVTIRGDGETKWRIADGTELEMPEKDKNGEEVDGKMQPVGWVAAIDGAEFFVDAVTPEIESEEEDDGLKKWNDALARAKALLGSRFDEPVGKIFSGKQSVTIGKVVVDEEPPISITFKHQKGQRRGEIAIGTTVNGKFGAFAWINGDQATLGDAIARTLETLQDDVKFMLTFQTDAPATVTPRPEPTPPVEPTPAPEPEAQPAPEEPVTVVPPPEPEPSFEIPPPPAEDPQKTADRAYLQSIIDGTVADILDPGHIEKLEAAYTRHEGDAEMEDLFNRAVMAYQEAELKASEALAA